MDFLLYLVKHILFLKINYIGNCFPSQMNSTKSYGAKNGTYILGHIYYIVFTSYIQLSLQVTHIFCTIFYVSLVIWNMCNCLIEHQVNKVRFRCRQGWQSRINYSPEQNNILYCLCMEYQGSSRSVRALCHSIILFHGRRCRFMRGPRSMIPSFFFLSFDFHLRCHSFVNYKLCHFHVFHFTTQDPGTFFLF